MFTKLSNDFHNLKPLIGISDNPLKAFKTAMESLKKPFTIIIDALITLISEHIGDAKLLDKILDTIKSKTPKCKAFFE